MKAVRLFIDRLETDTAIGTAQGTSRTIITICNYDKYQLQSQFEGTARGTEGAQQGHDKGTQKNTLNTVNTKKEGETTSPLSAEADGEPDLPPDLPPDPTPDLLPTADVVRLKAAADAKAAVELWNAMAATRGLAGVRGPLSEPRRRALQARLRECGGIEGWKTAMGLVASSEFLCGGKGWRAGFDFLLKASSFTKVMEGQYVQAAEKRREPAFPEYMRRMGYGEAPAENPGPPTIDGEALEA